MEGDFVLEDLYRQIDGAEAQMRAAEERLGNVRQAQQDIAGVVGRGEAADGQIVVECTSSDGLRTLELNPRVMRLSSSELAEGITSAFRQATDDLRAKSLQALERAGLLPGHSEHSRLDIDQVREQLRSTREQFVTTGRTAAQQMDQARELRRSREV